MAIMRGGVIKLVHSASSCATVMLCNMPVKFCPKIGGKNFLELPLRKPRFYLLYRLESEFPEEPFLLARSLVPGVM